MTAADGCRITLRLLGAVELQDARGCEAASVLAQPKRVALLAYLALAPAGEFVARAKLVGVFWPDLDEAHARAALRQALGFLRRSLGGALFVSRGLEALRLDGEACWCDVVAFERALAAGDVEGALALYQGELLDGVYLSHAPTFEEWRERQRARLARAYATALEQVAARRADDGDVVAAVECWRTLVAHLPESGRHVLGLMQALAAAGSRVEALHVAEWHRARLAREMGTTPDAAVLALAAQLRRPG